VNKPRKITIENYDVLKLSETAVLFSGQDVFSQTKEGQVINTSARFTFVSGGMGHRPSSLIDAASQTPIAQGWPRLTLMLDRAII
jgi:hypothetical protein